MCPNLVLTVPSPYCSHGAQSFREADKAVPTQAARNPQASAHCTQRMGEQIIPQASAHCTQRIGEQIIPQASAHHIPP